MAFKDRASALFPGIEWAGASDIHVSISGITGFFPAYKTADQVMHKLAVVGVGYKLFSRLCRHFPALNFLIDGSDFNHLFLKDMYRHLNGGGDTQSATKIVNPKTQNVFHMIARREDIVAGIRFWLVESVHPQVGKVIAICYRFRITTTGEEVEETTARVRVACEEAQTELEVCGIDMDIQEPPTETMTGEVVADQLFEGESL